MAMPCMVVSSVKPVKKTAKGKTSVRERIVTYEGSSGPRELLEAIVIQAQAAIKGLEGFKEPEKNPDEMTEEEKRMTAEDRKGKAKEVALPVTPPKRTPEDMDPVERSGPKPVSFFAPPSQDFEELLAMAPAPTDDVRALIALLAVLF